MLIIDSSPRNASKLKYKRQGAAISGLNIPQFENGIRNLGVLHDILARQFPEGQLESWVPGVSGGSMIFEASNRLFTPAYDMGPGAAIDFPVEWDVGRKLQTLGGDKFQFTEDNLVFYRMRNIEDDIERCECLTAIVLERRLIPMVINRSHAIPPAKFRLGDIVEMEFLVTAVRVGKERYRMLVKLKGLTLVDDSCSKVSSQPPGVAQQFANGTELQLASLSRIQQQMDRAKRSQGTKRSSSDVEDDDSEALKSVSRMRIDA